MKGHTSLSKGYILVEVSILIPILFFALLPFLLYVKDVSSRENINYVVCDEARHYSIYSSYTPLAIGLDKKIEERLENDNISISTSLISSDNYVKVDSVLLDKNKFSIRDKFFDSYRFRKFTGSNIAGSSLSREDFFNEREAKISYIFPKSGSHYHSRDCFYLKKFCISKVYLGGGRFCKICKSKGIEKGALVLVSKSGVIHRFNCNSINKYYKRTTLSDAKDAGYTKCKKCKGYSNE